MPVHCISKAGQSRQFFTILLLFFYLFCAGQSRSFTWKKLVEKRYLTIKQSMTLHSDNNGSSKRFYLDGLCQPEKQAGSQKLSPFENDMLVNIAV